MICVSFHLQLLIIIIIEKDFFKKNIMKIFQIAYSLFFKLQFSFSVKANE